MRDDVRLEDPRVPENRHVSGEDVAGAEGEGKNEAREGELTHFGAGLDPLPGDVGDVVGQVPVDQAGELRARHALGSVFVAHALDQPASFAVALRHGHRRKLVHVRSEGVKEVDRAHATPGDPVDRDAAGVGAQRHRLERAPRGSRPEQDARREGRRDHQVGQRDRRIGRLIGDADGFHEPSRSKGQPSWSKRPALPE